jgi:hypothetical protein
MAVTEGISVTTIQLPVDEITAQARQVHLGRVLLTVLAAVFFAIGWSAGRFFLGVAWCAVAVKLGWQAGRAHSGPAGTG